MNSWGFEEADEDDARADEPVTEEEPLTGADADGIVTVTVDDAAGVRSVRLGGGWQDNAVRRGLGTRVVDAMTAATTRAIARTVERAEVADDEPVPVASKPEEPVTPITADDVMRLLHTVSTDLSQFRQRLSAVVDETVTVTSAGGHATVSGRQGRVGVVSLDQDWLYGARASEVESELRDALTAFRAASSPGELAAGPRSSAISELLSIVSDPQTMVRRIRLRSAS